MKRIGIMGGTFNPIHTAHMIMAAAAWSQFTLDKVLFMPSKNPPHKQKANIISDEHRKRMIQLAIDGDSRFEFSDLELCREGTTYTSDTLKILQDNNPDSEIFFIIGGDSFQDLETWHEPKQVFSQCHLLVARRGQISKKDYISLSEEYTSKYHAKIDIIDMDKICISSKDIRKHIRHHEAFEYYCPDKVTKYIKNHALYGYTEDIAYDDIPSIQSALKCVMRPKRYRHILGVQYTCAALAMAHGADIKQAELAGLLHDCAKHLTFEEQMKLCNENHIELTKEEINAPALIHAKLGAFIAKTKYHIQDDIILSAIRWHTTGHANMTDIEKILFLSDFIEPSRTTDCRIRPLSELRKVAFQNLDLATYYILQEYDEYLTRCKNGLDPNAQLAYEFYQKETKNESIKGNG